jgi:branched-subunit amino acid ABC-type transport system permease component
VDLGVWLQVVLTGLSAGAVLGLVALGFSLVAGTVRVLHLAHGDIVLAAVLTGVLVLLGRTPVTTQLGLGRSLVLITIVLAAAVALAVLIAALLVGRGDTDSLTWVAGGVAFGLLLRAVLGLLLPQQAYAIPDPLRLSALTGNGLLALPGGSSIAVRALGVLGIALLLAVVAERVAVRSHLGQALRAVADDPVAAALSGIDVRRMVLLAFAFAGLLAGAAGLLDAPGHAVSVDGGVVLGLEAVAAALLGGWGSLRGAIAGGLVVGLLQSVAVQLGGAGLQDVVPLSLLLVLLVRRPLGVRS